MKRLSVFILSLVRLDFKLFRSEQRFIGHNAIEKNVEFRRVIFGSCKARDEVVHKSYQRNR